MNLNKWREAGICYEEGLSRFSENEELYIKYLKEFKSLTLYDELKEAFEKKDYKKAAEYAHNLKSYSGNIALNEFSSDISQLVNDLRNADKQVTSMSFDKLDEKYYRAIEAIGVEFGD